MHSTDSITSKYARISAFWSRRWRGGLVWLLVTPAASSMSDVDIDEIAPVRVRGSKGKKVEAPKFHNQLDRIKEL